MHARLFHVQVPLRRPLGHSAAVRDKAESLILVLEEDGFAGAGECVPRQYVTGENFDTVWNAVTARDPSLFLQRLKTGSPEELIRSVEAQQVHESLSHGTLALAAGCLVELCLLDFGTRKLGIPLKDLAFHAGLSPELLSRRDLKERISFTLDFLIEPDDIRRLVGPTLAHLKVKVGDNLQNDVKRLARCRAIYGPEFPISVDVNMAWSLEDALRAVEAFRPFNIAWYEEPLKVEDRGRYRELRERGRVRVMLDESGCSFSQIATSIASQGCDLINIRISKCGGFLSSLRLAQLCLEKKIGFQLGVQVGQLGVLNAAGRNFTSVVQGVLAAEGGPSLANLTDRILHEEVKLDWNAECLVGPKGPGLGVRLDFEKLEKYAVRSGIWTRKSGWSFTGPA